MKLDLVCQQCPLWGEETCAHIPSKMLHKIFSEVLIVGALGITVQTTDACFCCSNFAALGAQVRLTVERALRWFLVLWNSNSSLSFYISASFEIPDQTVPLHA